MNKQLSIVAAAALAVSGMAWTAHAQNTTDQPNALERAADKTGSAIKNGAEKTGEVVKEGAEKAKETVTRSSSKEEINDVLAQVAEAAMTKKGLNDMAERFVDADRNRLGQNKDAFKNAELDGLVAQLEQDWKAKYGHEFDIKDEDKVYDGFAMITEGEITKESAQQAGAKVEANTDRNPDGSVKAEVKVDNNTGVDVPKPNTNGQTAADKNLNDPGRNIASVTIPASHGLPEVKVPLIHEAGGWKIDIPDSLTTDKLRDNVKNALNMCKEHKDQWPADENEAFRGVSHKILAAIMDQPLDQAQKASDTQPPSAQPPAANPQ